MNGKILAMYNGGAWNKYVTPEVKARLMKIGMDGYALHAGPRGILGTDPDKDDRHDPSTLISFIRGFQPNAQLWLGIGLDGWTNYLAAHLLPKAGPSAPDQASPAAEKTVTTLFEKIAAFALSHGIVGITPDLEEAGKINPSACRVMARIFIATFRRCAPSLPLGHTAYDSPVAVENPPGSHHYWGGQSPYPFDAWLGDMNPLKRCDFEIAQNYTATKTGLAPKGSVRQRMKLSDRSFAALVLRGDMFPNVPILRYFQVHNTSRYDIINCATNEDLVFCWALGTSDIDKKLDDEGEIALTDLMKLKRLGYSGPGAIDRFLIATKTQVNANDHLYGPKAEAALAALKEP